MDPTVIFFAAMAGFVCYQLYKVLGTGGGEAGPEREEQKRPHLRVVEEVANHEQDTPQIAPEEVPEWLVQVRETWPEFDQKQFLEGAKSAYEMIVEAFSGGNMADMKPYLDPGVFNAFEEAVKARAAANQSAEMQFVGIDKAEIIDANTEKGFIKIVVDFTSNQTRLLRDAEGAVIEGDQNRIDLVRDRWTFSRSVRSRDPNWVLAATGTAAGQ